MAPSCTIWCAYPTDLLSFTLRPLLAAIPNLNMEDDAYNGMFIPKGSALILNCFTLHHNEARYPDAYVLQSILHIGNTNLRPRFPRCTGSLSTLIGTLVMSSAARSPPIRTQWSATTGLSELGASFIPYANE